ncbi:MAG: PaaI family thioesterase [Methylotenera sp.]|nr:PaaI family thioesterase [Oligoflexia bacterium]
MKSTKTTGSAIGLQVKYSPKSICFGCGPANSLGLRIQSCEDPSDPNQLVADWTPSPHHQAFPGVLNGGIIGALLDCHSNWTASWHLMKQTGTHEPPCTVTSDFAVKLMRPTPSDQPVHLTARVVPSAEGSTTDRATIEATLTSMINGVEKICATCRGTFVAVKPGHPAYHRW